MISLIPVFVLVILDRIFKILAEKYLAAGQLVVLIPHVFGLQLLQGGNTGAAFGMLSGHTGLLSAVSAVFSVALLYLLIRKEFVSKWVKAAFIMVTAGALGNLYDRLFIHSVTDYCVFLFMDFPIFNFADCLVDIGVAILVISIFRSKEEESLFVQ